MMQNTGYNRPIIWVSVMGTMGVLFGLLGGLCLAAPVADLASQIDLSDWMNGVILIIMFTMCFGLLTQSVKKTDTTAFH
jgi:hypothetical protein